MSEFGLALLAAVAMLVPLTGLPAFLVVVCAAVVGAATGIASGAIPPSLLAALPSRLINLLENDLLQALPLYVLVGALMLRLRVADSMFNATVGMLRGSRPAPAVAGLTLGALLGPMSGSVGASVVALSRAVAPRLAASGMDAPSRHALIAVSSTLGVVVPPSLVLILLADGMLHAHYVAVHVTHRTERIVNTQDVFRGAMIPAALFLLLCLCVAVWESRRAGTVEGSPTSRPVRADALVALATVALIVGLLAGVATGRFLPVEGAAAGAFILFVVAAASGRLRGGVLGSLLVDVMATTGTLFSLLLAATTFTLVFRALGSDKLLEAWILDAPLSSTTLTVIVLAVIGLSAVALDAFEIIFVMVPILIPPLLMRVPDASWIAVLVLLALQASYLFPPMGYALLMTRGVLGEKVSARATARRVAPYVVAQLIVLVSVLAFPGLVHLGQPAETGGPAEAPAMPDEEVGRRLQEMLAPPTETDDPSGGSPAAK
jgi:tripartite ATP-independent transporter DctM subunit